MVEPNQLGSINEEISIPLSRYQTRKITFEEDDPLKKINWNIDLSEANYSFQKIVDIIISEEDNELKEQIQTSDDCINIFNRFGKAHTSFLFLLNIQESDTIKNIDTNLKKRQILDKFFGKENIENQYDFSSVDKKDYGIYLHLLYSEENQKSIGCFEVKGLNELSEQLKIRIIFLLNCLSEYTLVFEEELNLLNILDISGISTIAKSIEEEDIFDSKFKEEFSILSDLVLIADEDLGNLEDFVVFKNFNNKEFGKVNNKDKAKFIKNCKYCFQYFMDSSKLEYEDLVAKFENNAFTVQYDHVSVYNNINILFSFFNFKNWSCYLELYKINMTGNLIFSIIFQYLSNIFNEKMSTIKRILYDSLASETSDKVKVEAQNYNEAIISLGENATIVKSNRVTISAPILESNESEDNDDEKNQDCVPIEGLIEEISTKRKSFLDNFINDCYMTFSEPFIEYFNFYFEETLYYMKEVVKIYIENISESLKNVTESLIYNFNQNLRFLGINTFPLDDQDDQYDINKDFENFVQCFNSVFESNFSAIDDNFSWLKQSYFILNEQICSILVNVFNIIGKKYNDLLKEKNFKLKNLTFDKNELEKQLHIETAEVSRLQLDISKLENEVKKQELFIEDYKNRVLESDAQYCEMVETKDNEIRDLKRKLQQAPIEKKEDLDRVDFRETFELLKNAYYDFKDGVDKLEKQKSTIFNDFFSTDSISQNEKNNINMIDSIKKTVDDYLEMIKNTYIVEIKELDERFVKENLTCITLKIQLQDEKAQKENLLRVNSEIKEDHKIYEKKISSLSSQILELEETLKLKDNKITSHEHEIDKLESMVNKYSSDFNWLRDEVDIILEVFRGILVIF